MSKSCCDIIHLLYYERNTNYTPHTTSPNVNMELKIRSLSVDWSQCTSEITWYHICFWITQSDILAINAKLFTQMSLNVVSLFFLACNNFSPVVMVIWYLHLYIRHVDKAVAAVVCERQRFRQVNFHSESRCNAIVAMWDIDLQTYLSRYRHQQLRSSLTKCHSTMVDCFRKPVQLTPNIRSRRILTQSIIKFCRPFAIVLNLVSRGLKIIP